MLGGKGKRLEHAEPRPEPAEACPERCRRGWAAGLYRSVRVGGTELKGEERVADAVGV